MLALILGLVIGANYTPHTILSGWDTLHPEFNFPLAFERMVSGVWRADQGLGAAAGHSHMADLPRVFLLWLTSFILPQELLRYAFFFSALRVPGKALQRTRGVYGGALLSRQSRNCPALYCAV